MTLQKFIRLAPPNSIFFFEDAVGGRSPELDDQEIRIWASQSTLIVGCLANMDGDTDLTVSDSEADALGELPRFQCIIDTPSRVLQVTTSELKLLMEFTVAGSRTRVRVWTNRLQEPDRIVVVLG